ncbi:MAG: hypothetical protein IPO39_11490 [Bacteroidetes bacterium]|nr:hypothetical protein [Bacteroidota bacterium]
MDVKRQKTDLIQSEILHAENCWTSFNKSQSIFNSIMSKINASAGGFDYKIELEEAIEFLRLKFTETESPTIGFNYYFLATEKAQKESDYFSAARLLEQLIVIIER